MKPKPPAGISNCGEPGLAPAGKVCRYTTTSCGRVSVPLVEPVSHSPMAIVFEVPSVTDWRPIGGPKTWNMPLGAAEPTVNSA